MMLKSYTFEEKQSKITKEQIFCTIFNFLKSSSQIFGLLEGPGSYYNYPFYQSSKNNSVPMPPNIAYL